MNSFHHWYFYYIQIITNQPKKKKKISQWYRVILAHYLVVWCTLLSFCVIHFYNSMAHSHRIPRGTLLLRCWLLTKRGIEWECVHVEVTRYLSHFTWQMDIMLGIHRRIFGHTPSEGYEKALVTIQIGWFKLQIIQLHHLQLVLGSWDHISTPFKINWNKIVTHP